MLVIYIQYKFHLIPSIAYIAYKIMADDGNNHCNLDKGQCLLYS